MELQGKIINALPERRGTSQRGTEWVVQSFVLETHEQYPKKMMFEVFGEDRLQRFAIQVGQEVNVAFDIDAHEYNGRWYNSIRAFDVRQVDPAAVAPAAQPAAAPVQTAPAAAPVAPTAAPAAAPAATGDTAEDLPF